MTAAAITGQSRCGADGAGSVNPVIIGNATLYLGSCEDILPTLPKVDAVVTDPPYGIGAIMKGGGWAETSGYNAMDEWDAVAPQALVELSIEKAEKAIIWGGNYFSLPPARGWLTWNKLGSAPKMADCEFAWTNLDMVARLFSHQIENGFLRVNSGFRHPTQKPVSVMAWCLGFVPDAATILDPFMGSGTTGVAALQMGRKFIGIEREPKYFEAACRRIRETTGEDAGPLFGSAA